MSHPPSYFWQVDAFTKEIFKGNPAAVFLVEEFPDTELMQMIAREMNLSETVFVSLKTPSSIRWFTPAAEVDLCGHATLAAAHILWELDRVSGDHLSFESRSGPLYVKRGSEGYTLDFPLQPPKEMPEYDSLLHDILGISPEYIGSNGEDCMAVVNDPSFVLKYHPNAALISEIPERGFLLAAQDKKGKHDYLYRGFFPKLGILEDPVTGSANTCLAPYFAKKSGKEILSAYQASERGGELFLQIHGDRLLISGEAVTVFEGRWRGSERKNSSLSRKGKFLMGG